MSGPTHARKFDQAPAEMLEEPTMRVPYELMRRSHRAAQRQIEKDFTFLQTSIKSARSTTDPAILLETLSTCSARSTALKRKFETLQPSSSNPSPLKDRLPILHAISSIATPAISSSPSDLTPTTPTPDQYPQFSSTRLTRLILEYLLRTSLPLTATTFARETDQERQVDMKLFGECARVEKALVEGRSCTEALGWCGENRGTLKKTKNNLEFSLRLQEYIELCRLRRPESALTYAKKFLAPWAGSHMAEVQRAMALLAFGEGCGVESYKALYATSRWTELAKEFRQTFNGIYGIPSNPLLSLTMAAGIASLKLAACLPPVVPAQPVEDVSMDETGDGFPPTGTAPLPPATLTTTTPAHTHPPTSNITDQRSLDCPTCNPDMAILARGIPFSHHTNSKLVCRISGEVMDDENPPLAFPNGYVYSRKAMQHMSGDDPKAIVTCPRSGMSCQYSKLKKVFVS